MTKTFQEQIADELYEMKLLGVRVPLKAFKIAQETNDDSPILAILDSGISISEAASMCIELSF